MKTQDKKIIKISSFSALDIGKKKKINEDNLLIFEPTDNKILKKKGNLYVVADGVGGLSKGEIASKTAVDNIKKYYYSFKSTDPKRSLVKAIKKTNLDILSISSEEEKMCTTVVSLVIKENVAYIANVGDSRAYLFRENKLKILSKDHSYVAERVRSGELTEEEARVHPRKNIILQCLGDNKKIKIDLFSYKIIKGDKFLLCSDGLWGELPNNRLEELVAIESEKAIIELVKEANEAGGNDNISVILVDIV
jgi:PPM family protein phosphatase